MVMSTDNAAALVSEAGPPLEQPAVWRNNTGLDLLFERSDLGPGCTTLVAAGGPIPAPLHGLPCRDRATGEPVELSTWPNPGDDAYEPFLDLVRAAMDEYGVQAHTDLPPAVMDNCASKARATVAEAKGSKR
jgi:hypothetical protein